MQWSKLKTRLKAFVAPELSERVDFHMARYRNAHDQAGRIWFTIDKIEVAEFSELKWWVNSCEIMSAKSAEGGRISWSETWPLNTAAGKYSDGEALIYLKAFLDLSITEALRSRNHLVRAFAMIDRRLGKRSFANIRLTENDHPLTRAFYNLRASAFGLNSVSRN